MPERAFDLLQEVASRRVGRPRIHRGRDQEWNRQIVGIADAKTPAIMIDELAAIAFRIERRTRDDQILA
jgi:hypothetical protein